MNGPTPWNGAQVEGVVMTDFSDRVCCVCAMQPVVTTTYVITVTVSVVEKLKETMEDIENSMMSFKEQQRKM